MRQLANSPFSAQGCESSEYSRHVVLDDPERGWEKGRNREKKGALPCEKIYTGRGIGTMLATHGIQRTTYETNSESLSSIISFGGGFAERVE